MALVLSGERPAAARPSFNPLDTLVGWAARRRAERTQKAALRDLLALDGDQLRDLGLERADLFDALRAGARPTGFLADRRARKSF